MKSVLSAILAVVVALSASCCSGKNNDSGSSTEPDASTSQTTEVTAEPVTEELRTTLPWKLSRQLAQIQSVSCAEADSSTPGTP